MTKANCSDTIQIVNPIQEIVDEEGRFRKKAERELAPKAENASRFLKKATASECTAKQK